MAKEYIEREDVLSLKKPFPNQKGMITLYRQYFINPEAVEQLPAADVRPVVTCRECKHRGWVQEPCHGKSVDYCRVLDRCVNKEFFCAGGERRESYNEP